MTQPTWPQCSRSSASSWSRGATSTRPRWTAQCATSPRRLAAAQVAPFLLCRTRLAGGRAELSGSHRRQVDDGVRDRLRDGAARIWCIAPWSARQAPTSSSWMLAATIRWRAISRAPSARAQRRSGAALPPVESGEGTLISFSTQPGNVALDGTGRNSPYAAALLKHIATPGDDLPTILINVRNDVMQATARRQVPWEHSAHDGKVLLHRRRNPPRRRSSWRSGLSVKDSNSPAVLATYLDRYPKGEFAPVARALDGALRPAAQAGAGETGGGEKAPGRGEASGRSEAARERAAGSRSRDCSGPASAPRMRRTARKRNAWNTERAELLARNEELRKALDEARLQRAKPPRSQDSDG